MSGWCRPEEFYAEYELAVNNFSAGDMCQGDIGDGWLLSAFALVAQRPDLLRQVFPSTLRSSTGASARAHTTAAVARTQRHPLPSRT